MLFDYRVVLASAILALALAGCSSTSEAPSASSAEVERIAMLEQELANKEAQNADLMASVESLEMKLDEAPAPAERSFSPAATGAADLPPNALPGHCYARVLVPPVYETSPVEVVARAASERVEVIPAKYEWVEKQVEVTPPSERVEVIPAKFDTVTETVVVKEPSERLEVVPAKYEWIDEQVEVEPAREETITEPAVYDTVSERILVKPAFTTWKKGRGPIEKIDNATGEIMCLVEVPAEYNTVTKKVLVKPESKRTVTIPAKFRTVRKKVMVEPPKTRSVTIPGETRQVKKRVMIEPPKTRTIPVEGKYKTVRVRQLVEPAKERRIPVPAEVKTVTKRTLVTDSNLEWREILCETNTDEGVVKALQRALKSKGYNPGPIDGVVGPETMGAVNRFQKDEGLARGQLTIKTLEKLGVQL